MENSLEFIEKLGFKYAGRWVLDEKGKIKPCFIEAKKEQEKVLYAFVVDGTVKYAGKTARTLKARMGSYRDEIGGSTNRRIKGIILDILKPKNKKDVLIYVLSNDDIKVNDEIISLTTFTAGLEDKVIGKLSPEWNIQGVEK